MKEKKLYNDYTSYLATRLGGENGMKIQKISIHAGFSCPNRDGKVGVGGCTFCNNQTFHPDYCQPHKSITQQLEEGIYFFRKKHKEQHYLAYFQAFTNTYAPLPTLIERYEEALRHPLVEGIVIGTRPDCVDAPLLDYLSEVNQRKLVMIEYGVESTSDETLRLINRGHDFHCAQEAITETHRRGIDICVHLILGLPQESRELMLTHATRLSKLPINNLKLHQLQLIRNTMMERQYQEHPEWFHLLTVEEYIDLAIDFIEHTRPDIILERFVSQSPKELLIAPDWGLKNYEFVAKLEKRMRERGSFQGKKYQCG